MAAKKFDAIVVGAGTGGTTTARFLASDGFKVCLVEAKSREKIGDKVCGDAVGTEVFEFLGIAPPKGEEMSARIKGAKLYSPDKKTCITMVDPKQAGFVVNRLQFGQRLLDEALDAGDVELLDYCNFLDVVLEGGELAGVLVKDKRNRETVELRAPVVVDASGYHPAVRKHLTADGLPETSVNDAEDAIICFREIVELEPGRRVNDPEYISIYLHPRHAPGGYLWYFPRSETSVNAGIGIFPNWKRYLRQFFNKYVKRAFFGGQKLKIGHSGGGIVSVRHPLKSAVADNFLLVGDSAAQVNPLHGGGIDPSMRAGWMAAKAIASAHAAGSYSKENLWGYNVEFARGTGSEFAALDVLRIALQGFSVDKLNFGLSRGLLTGPEILEVASTGGVNLGVLDLLGKAIKGIAKPDLLLDLAYVNGKMKEAKRLFTSYPESPTGLAAWKRRVDRLFRNVRATMGPDRKKFMTDNLKQGRGPIHRLL
ncbi:MAG: NAD(P)/FAD-dependent oxidoreductase [Promethearchaeota archaeon]